MNILNIQLIPTCTQLRQVNTIAPVQQGCMLAIITWLLFAIRNDAFNIYIDYFNVWSYYALEYIVTYYFAGITYSYCC